MWVVIGGTLASVFAALFGILADSQKRFRNWLIALALVGGACATVQAFSDQRAAQYSENILQILAATAKPFPQFLEKIDQAKYNVANAKHLKRNLQFEPTEDVIGYDGATGNTNSLTAVIALTSEDVASLYSADLHEGKADTNELECYFRRAFFRDPCDKVRHWRQSLADTVASWSRWLPWNSGSADDGHRDNDVFQIEFQDHFDVIVRYVAKRCGVKLGQATYHLDGKEVTRRYATDGAASVKLPEGSLSIAAGATPAAYYAAAFSGLLRPGVVSASCHL